MQNSNLSASKNDAEACPITIIRFSPLVDKISTRGDFFMMLRSLYPYGSALTRPVTIPFRNRFAHALARSALGAPERGAGSPNGLTEGFS